MPAKKFQMFKNQSKAYYVSIKYCGFWPQAQIRTVNPDIKEFYTANLYCQVVRMTVSCTFTFFPSAGRISA